MSKKVLEGKILSNEMISPDIFEMVIESGEVATSSDVGMFVNIYPRAQSTLLPRPISISQIDETTITLVYAVVGEGTKEFSLYQAGETIRVSTALGNGFKPQPVKKHVLVGGGIGVPPLVELAKRLEGEVIAVVGFREEPFLIETLEAAGAKVYIATDNGSVGFKGNVIELIKAEGITGDYFYSCGPKVMLRALAAHCEAEGVPVQVSLEERMGCGYGACVGCVCKTKKTAEEKAESKKVCKDGPVFLGSEVVWE